MFLQGRRGGGPGRGDKGLGLGLGLSYPHPGDGECSVFPGRPRNTSRREAPRVSSVTKSFVSYSGHTCDISVFGWETNRKTCPFGAV